MNILNYIFIKNNSTIPFGILVITVFLTFFYYLVDAFAFSMPHGYDEIITAWPIGRALSESTLQDFPRTLMASFLGEDHLFPVTNFVSYLIYSSKFDPISTISIATKVIYVAWLAVTAILVNLLYSNKLKTVVAVGFLLANQALIFYNATFNISFNLVIFFSVLGIYFVTKYILTRNSKFLIYTYLVVLLGTFSFENFFATYSVIMLFASYKIYFLNETNRNKFWIVSKIAFVLCIALLPYLVLHYDQYGTIIPGSRLEITGDGNPLKNSLLVGARILNDWFYGIPKYSFSNYSSALLAIFPISIFIFIIRHKIDLFSNQNTNALMFSSILTLPICMFTGRYFPGLWTFVGIIFVIAFSDIIVRTMGKLLRTDSGRAGWLTALILSLLFFNLKAQPFQHRSNDYRNVNESSIVAFKLIDYGSKQLTLVRLPGAEELSHPIAFWIGNQIYHKRPGLSYFKDYNILRMSDMFIESYKNSENKMFSFFEGFLNKRTHNGLILFKTRNVFFTFDGGKSNSVIFRASSLPNSPSDFYEIYLPQFVSTVSTKNKLTIELELGQTISNLDKLIYGGKRVLNFNVDGNKVIFYTDDYSSPNRISIVSNSTDKFISLKTIEISSPINTRKPSTSKGPENTSFPSVSANLTPCSFELKSPFVDVYMTMGPTGTLSLDTLHPISEIWPSFVINYSSFDTHRDIKVSGNNLKFNGDSQATINCI